MTTKGTNHQKDNMSIGSAESLAPRWGIGGGGVPNNSTTATPSSPSTPTTTNQNQNTSTTNNQNANNTNMIHWVGIIRDQNVLLCEYNNEMNNTKMIQMSRRFLKSNTSSSSSASSNNNNNNTSSKQPSSTTNTSSNTSTSITISNLPKVDWEFKTYAIQSQRRMVHAIKFHIYEMIPMKVGSRAKLTNLITHSFLNNEIVRIIEYQSSTQKYLIRPSIPLPDAQKLATTGMLVVHSKNLIPIQTPEIRIWTYAALYDGKSLTQNLACQFIEKICILSENLRINDTIWSTSTNDLCCQTMFSTILQSQICNYYNDILNYQQNQKENPDLSNSIDMNLEYSKAIIESNINIVMLLQQTTTGSNSNQNTNNKDNQNQKNNQNLLHPV